MTAAPGRAEWVAAREEFARRVAALPSLHLYVYPTKSGMRLSLALYSSFAGGRRTVEVLRQAEWTPSEVSAEKLVDWGRRACADWLAEPTVSLVTQGPWPPR